MQHSLKCPFCNSSFPVLESTYKEIDFSFEQDNPTDFAWHFSKKITEMETLKDACTVEISKCPSCSKHSIKIIGMGSEVLGINLNVYPDSRAKVFPDYIPSSIKQDYEEACKIVNLSPKASATLSRRCLQGMIRDYWEVSGKKNLYQEIDAIADKVTPQVKKVLDSVRQIGNIGAHMEKDINLIVDIEPDEAQQLINLIEYLMEQWYIQRYESELMLASIIDINESKQEERKV